MTFFDFFRKEKFLLIEISRRKTSGLLLSLDSAKKLRLEKFWESPKESKFLGYLKGIGTIKKTIIAVEPEFSFTTVIPLSLQRENVREPLEKVELENLLAQAVSRVFNQYRQEAGRELNIDELDVILADSRVTNFKVDGNQVINPLGFRAKEIRAVFEMTFSTRQVFSEIKSFLKNNDDFFFTEIGRAELRAIHKISPPPVNLLMLGGDRSYFFSMEKTAAGWLMARKEPRWSTSGLPKIISGHWSVSEKAAVGLYRAYLQKNVSPAVEKYFKKIFTPAIDSLLRQMQKFKPSGKIYLDADEAPMALLTERRSALGEFPLDAFLEKAGFGINANKWFPEQSRVFRKLAPFFEFYYDKSNTDINHWLRRRLHWLGSGITH